MLCNYTQLLSKPHKFSQLLQSPATATKASYSLIIAVTEWHLWPSYRL